MSQLSKIRIPAALRLLSMSSSSLPGDVPRAYCLKNHEIFSPFRGPEIIILFVATAENSSMVLDLNHAMPQLFEGDQHGGVQALRSQCNGEKRGA